MTKFHFDNTYDSKETTENLTPYDEVTHFEVCRFINNTKI